MKLCGHGYRCKGTFTGRTDVWKADFRLLQYNERKDRHFSCPKVKSQVIAILENMRDKTSLQTGNGSSRNTSQESGWVTWLVTRMKTSQYECSKLNLQMKFTPQRGNNAPKIITFSRRTPYTSNGIFKNQSTW